MTSGPSEPGGERPGRDDSRDAARRRAEIEFRAQYAAERPRGHSWLNIAGLVGAILLVIFLAVFYLDPIGVLRWSARVQLELSGVTHNQVSFGDQPMSYYTAGPSAGAHPVLLIHGLGPDAALVWRSVMKPIANGGHFRVIAPDLMGFASSGHQKVDYSIAYQAAAVGRLVDYLKLRRVSIVGWDLGADVALYYAVDHPGKVASLILVSGGLFGRQGAWTLANSMLPDNAQRMRAQVAQSFFDLPPMPSFMYPRMVASSAGDLPAETDMLKSVPADEAHITARLGRLFNTVAVVVRGGRDPYYSSRRAETLHDALPGSATVIFKTSGHYPQLEDPADFAGAVTFILKQTEAAH